MIYWVLFQPTLPVRGATPQAAYPAASIHISTHAPRAGSDFPPHILHCRGAISTHAPRAGSDNPAPPPPPFLTNFNPRSPCGERPHQQIFYRRHCYFNPRSPCGERHSGTKGDSMQIDFNPRSPCGERHSPTSVSAMQLSISTHAPRAGSDTAICHQAPNHAQFQPTLPVRGATNV